MHFSLISAYVDSHHAVPTPGRIGISFFVPEKLQGCQRNVMVKNQEVASELSNKLLKISGAINEAIILVQDRCPDDEFRVFRLAMGRLLDHLYVLGLEPLYEEHPEIVPPEMQLKPRGKTQ
jgi:hypothetical protein